MLRYLGVIAALSLTACAARPSADAIATTPAPASPAPKPADNAAPLTQLVGAVNIPYDSFTLDNGMRVLVHTDRKAPVVAVSVWYAVGSKNEPKGKTGFAHLFEHLMFNGSENAPGDFFEPLQQIGATDFNGTTWFDRTNYFETVPTGAIDRALMLESDRMGHLLGAVTQEKLDNQIGVVQNEKRQGDNGPFGLVEYEQLENLYPSGHPYHHSTIGSMADLSSASLADVKGWFKDNYGPNNAVLVLAGDIDLATARDKVTKWFGAIPAGPVVKPVTVSVPTLAAPVSKTIKDQVATTRIYRMWAVPGLDNPDYLPLEVGGLVLGGLSSSRLDDVLVRQKQLAVAVSASADIFAQAGQFVVYADVKPGGDVAATAAALDAEIARIVASGPDADELARAATRFAASEIRGLERIGGFSGKAPTLAEGLLYSGDPATYRKQLDRVAAMTPAQVQAALSKWLSRPAFSLVVEPGVRTEGGENRGGFVVAPDSGARPAFWRDPQMSEGSAGASAPLSATDPDRSKLPPVGTLAPLDFPTIESTTLSNGIKVHFARRTSVPLVSVRVAFDAGNAADPASAPGTGAMLLQLMDEGTQALDSTALARLRERLGVEISGSASSDRTNFDLDALTPNLAPSLTLLADYIRTPALAPSELERVRTQQLAAISAELKDPTALSRRTLPTLLFGDAHPYGVSPTGSGSAAAVTAMTRDDLVRYHQQWLRPDKAEIFVVGDTTMAQLKPLLETSFGTWQASAGTAPVKDFSTPTPAARPRIVLIDRPASPQSVIYAGELLDATGRSDLIDLKSANDVLGGNFLSRINMNLRETKGWSYGSRSSVRDPLERAQFYISAPVQADKTGAAIVELRKELNGFLSSKGVTGAELERTSNGNVRELPGSFETNDDVLAGMTRIFTYALPVDYYETLAGRYQGMTAPALNNAARAALHPDKLTWLIVGDRKVVEPQLKKLGLPVEVIPAPQ